MNPSYPDTGPLSQLLETSRTLFARGEWEGARQSLEEASHEADHPEILEELGWAALMCEDGLSAINARERAFALYREQSNRQGAARVALWLVFDYLEYRGSYAVANGWLQRAHSLLQEAQVCVEHGLLAYVEGTLASTVRRDNIAAQQLGEHVVRIGRQTGRAELEMLGRALEGYARVNAGEISRGMDLLDESAAIATGGEVTDVNSIGYACCHMISACEQIRDYDRADQWCRRLKELCEKWRLKSFFAYCRTRYSAILVARGEWAEAERELLAARNVLSEYRPGLTDESIVHLAELYRRQGRITDAIALFEQTHTHHLSLLGRSACALDQGDPVAAREFAGHYLRKIQPESRAQRIGGLELLIQADLALGHWEDARRYLSELETTTEIIQSDQVCALTDYLRGLAAVCSEDFGAARDFLSDAADRYDRVASPYEGATARLTLASVFQSLGRPDRAEKEAKAALGVFRALGAEHARAKAENFLQEISRREHSAIRGVTPRAPNGVTRREQEILRLLVSGMSNEAIAAQLFLSVRTVERHLSNIYQKLGLTGKSARTAAVAYALRNDLG